ncbi:MAG: hypothetical protein ABIS36_10735 [Chryseolinea sp.]
MPQNFGKGLPYERAFALFEDDEENQKDSLRILADLGAAATLTMLKPKLKFGLSKISPRGPMKVRVRIRPPFQPTN